VIAFRLYVEGALVDEHTASIHDGDILAELAGVVGGHQADLALAASERGDTYMVEIAWDDGTFTRWGTDAGGMVIPTEVGMEQLEAKLRELSVS
jgi:hypothetical protein